MGMKREEYIRAVKEAMYKPELIRNIGIVAHVHHGKTTLSDSLLAMAGIISYDLAGEQLYLNYEAFEREHALTAKSGFVTMVHEFEGRKYLINLIDTPGHVDFSGEVTRALRAIDGVVLVVDAVEGVMAQTEMNLRQALLERCKPVLFINKTDRLIKELRLKPEEMQKKLQEVIEQVNDLIERYAPEEFKDKWKVSITAGSVAIGSAKQKWAISFPWMQKTGITFKHIVDWLLHDQLDTLRERCPVHTITLDMVVRHLPDPRTAQDYRIPVIWRGDPESEIGKKMRRCETDAPLMAVVCQNRLDKHAGLVSIVRIFSGKVRPGMRVYLLTERKEVRVQQVGIYKGPERIVMDEIPAGNVAALVGLAEFVSTGETISELPDVEPFEEIRHYAEPVVTVAVEPENPQDLTKLIEALRDIAKEDNTVRVTIREDTGEYLISALGDLHIDRIVYELETKKGLKVKVSPPTVVYKETIVGSYGPIEGKSPNKHNKFYIIVEPLEESVKQAFERGELHDGEPSKKDIKLLMDLMQNKEEARGVIYIYKGNLLINLTKGQQFFDEVKDYIIQAFKEVMDMGPLAKEPVTGVKVKIVDAVIHEDPAHRGQYQIIMAVKPALQEALLKAGMILLEPIQRVEILTSMDYLSGITAELQRRRGKIEDVVQERENIKIIAYLPVSESFGLANALRSLASGKVVWYYVFAGFQPVPRELMEETIRKIRQRKGLE
ncbi:MAG: elongation factor EF-2 [bacterium]|nr:elongation factor EF-2 [bacterium]